MALISKDKEKWRAYKRAYYAAHKDEIAAKRKAIRNANNEEYNSKMKAYRDAHRERIRAFDRAYYAAHRNERLGKVNKERARLYQATHKEQINARRRALYAEKHPDKRHYTRKTKDVQEIKEAAMTKAQAATKATVQPPKPRLDDITEKQYQEFQNSKYRAAEERKERIKELAIKRYGWYNPFRRYNDNGVMI